MRKLRQLRTLASTLRGFHVLWVRGTQRKPGAASTWQAFCFVATSLSDCYQPDGIAVDPQNDMVYSAGCRRRGLAYNAMASIVNGTSGTIVKTVDLSSAYYTTMTLDPTSDVLYVSGERMLAAFDGTNGDQIFQADPPDLWLSSWAWGSTRPRIRCLSLPRTTTICSYTTVPRGARQHVLLPQLHRSCRLRPQHRRDLCGQDRGADRASSSYASTGSVDTGLIDADLGCAPSLNSSLRTQASTRIESGGGAMNPCVQDLTIDPVRSHI